MKIKNFILGALVLGINSLSYAQDPYPPINRSTTINGETISQILAQVDSMAPATDPITDSLVTVNDSIHDSTAVAQVPATALDTAHNAAAAHEGDTHHMSISQWWGQTIGYPLPIAVGIIVTLILLYGRGLIKNPFKRKPLMDRLKNELDVVKIEQQIKDVIANSGVNRKKYAIEKLSRAFMKECQIELEKGLSVGEVNKLMDQILEKMLEGKLYLRFDWRPVYRIFGLAMGVALIAALFIWAMTPHVTYVTNNLQAVDTTKVMSVVPAVDVEEEVYHEPTSYREHQTVAQTPSGQPMMVFVPSQGESKPVYTKWADANELSEKSGYYQVAVKQGHRFRAKALGPLRLILANGNYVDYGPNDYVDLSNSGLNGKLVFASTTGQATHAAFTLEPI